MSNEQAFDKSPQKQRDKLISFTLKKKKNWDRREEEVDRTTWDLMDGGLSRTSKRAAEMMKTRLWLFCINILRHQPEKLFLLAFFLL